MDISTLLYQGRVVNGILNAVERELNHAEKVLSAFRWLRLILVPLFILPMMSGVLVAVPTDDIHLVVLGSAAGLLVSFAVLRLIGSMEAAVRRKVDEGPFPPSKVLDWARSRHAELQEASLSFADSVDYAAEVEEIERRFRQISELMEPLSSGGVRRA